MNKKPAEYRFRGFRLRFNRTIVMGILNITPDSFSDGGDFMKTSSAVKQADTMAAEGADIIDVGGESSRPGAKAMTVDEEAKRVIPVIRKIVKRHPKIPVSIDTYKPEVARRAIDEGAAIINDISGLRDPAMAELAAQAGAPVVVMHMKGTPETMQKRPAYKDVVGDIVSFFRERIKYCRKMGIDNVILDPGIGFGKTKNHNLEIIRRFHEFNALGCPTLIGVSRKSFIGKTLGAMVNDRETGTVAANAIAIARGADIIRVHDVALNRQAAMMADFIEQGMKHKKRVLNKR